MGAINPPPSPSAANPPPQSHSDIQHPQASPPPNPPIAEAPKLRTRSPWAALKGITKSLFAPSCSKHAPPAHSVGVSGEARAGGMQQIKATSSAGAVTTITTGATPTQNRMGSAGEDRLVECRGARQDRLVESGRLARNSLPRASDHS